MNVVNQRRRKTCIRSFDRRDAHLKSGHARSAERPPLRLSGHSIRSLDRPNARRLPRLARTRRRSRTGRPYRPPAFGSRVRSLSGIQRLAFQRVEFDADPLASCSRSRAEINNHVEDRPAHTANDLGFLVRFSLKVHTPERPSPRVTRQGALRHLGIQTVRGELVSVPRPGEEPALVLVPLSSTRNAPSSSSGTTSRSTTTFAR